MTDPQRERAEQEAGKWLIENEFRNATSGDRASLADLLLDFAREARLDEANWWYVVQGTVAENERITQLQTPQPAKKGMGT